MKIPQYEMQWGAEPFALVGERRQAVKCAKCGHELAGAACEHCAQAAALVAQAERAQATFNLQAAHE